MTHPGTRLQAPQPRNLVPANPNNESMLMICDNPPAPCTRSASALPSDTPRMRTIEQHNPNTSAFPLVYLASKSPRRRLMLQEAGIRHELLDSGVDDGTLHPGAAKPDEWVMALAYLKASAALARLSHPTPSSPHIILGADTIVADDAGAGPEIIGQPRDRADAERILRRLIRGEHDVLTGIAIIDPVSGRRELFTDKAHVTVGHIADADLAAYLDSGSWAGKAGAYNLSERLAAGWPINVSGDPGTVMGLPMQALLVRLGAW